MLIGWVNCSGKGVLFVECWNLLFCGDFDMWIVCDGIWYYFGSFIGWKVFVNLFVLVLWCDDDGKYYFVIFVEKIGIIVDDVFFLVVEMVIEGIGSD